MTNKKSPRNKDNSGIPSSGNDGAFAFKVRPESTLALGENWPDDLSELTAEHAPGDNGNWPDPSEAREIVTPYDEIGNPDSSPERILSALEEDMVHLGFVAGEGSSDPLFEQSLTQAARNPSSDAAVHRFVVENTRDAAVLGNVMAKSDDPEVIDAAFRKMRSLDGSEGNDSWMQVLADNENTSADTLALVARRTDGVVKHPNTDAQTLDMVAERVLGDYGKGNNVRDRVSESVLYRIANHKNASDDVIKTFGAHEKANVRLMSVESGRLSDTQLGFFAEFDPSEMVRDRAATQVAMRDLRASGHLTDD